MVFNWGFLKNYAFWIALAAFILLILQNANVGVNPVAFNQIVTGFLGLLVLAGVVNSPTPSPPVQAKNDFVSPATGNK